MSSSVLIYQKTVQPFSPILAYWEGLSFNDQAIGAIYEKDSSSLASTYMNGSILSYTHLQHAGFQVDWLYLNPRPQLVLRVGWRRQRRARRIRRRMFWSSSFLE